MRTFHDDEEGGDEKLEDWVLSIVVGGTATTVCASLGGRELIPYPARRRFCASPRLRRDARVVVGVLFVVVVAASDDDDDVLILR